MTVCMHASRSHRSLVSTPVHGFSHRPPLANALKKSASMGHTNRQLLRQLSAPANLHPNEEVIKVPDTTQCVSFAWRFSERPLHYKKERQPEYTHLRNVV